MKKATVIAGAIASFWDEWNIQIRVILSFVLQVILLCCAGIRRRGGASALWRILLWLAYQTADYTAIYALGHMSLSLSKRTQRHQLTTISLVPFWALFLLHHLGGPDTITAYALQDNQLWLRHLFSLVAQVLGAAYVLYLFVARTNPAGMMLATAALIMFVSGCLKYGERTLALKRAGFNSIAASALFSARYWSAYDPWRQEGGEGMQELDTEEVLLAAHCMLGYCKGILTDERMHGLGGIEHSIVDQGIRLHGGKFMLELAAMELSLLYDTLYTKATVIHTWQGLCIRIVSPLSAVAAFVLFQLSRSNKLLDACSTADVAVTYFLLVGTMAVEFASSLRVAGSSWVCASLREWGLLRLCSTVMRLRRMLKAGARRRACLDTIGQYNLLDFCIDYDRQFKTSEDLRRKIAEKIGLGDQWQELHYSTTMPISDGLKALLLKEFQKRKLDDLRNARGTWILKEKHMYNDLKRINDHMDLDIIILVWHIATELYLSQRPGGAEAFGDSIMVLSNHMVFLLMVHPYLLPVVVRSRRYKKDIKYLYGSFRYVFSPKLSRSEIVEKIGLKPRVPDFHSEVTPILADGFWLAEKLVENSWDLGNNEMLEVIAGVWVEMLCYASYRCGGESHARKLSTGGELINALWLILGQAEQYNKSNTILADSNTSCRDYLPAGLTSDDCRASQDATQPDTCLAEMVVGHRTA